MGIIVRAPQEPGDKRHPELPMMVTSFDINYKHQSSVFTQLSESADTFID